MIGELRVADELTPQRAGAAAEVGYPRCAKVGENLYGDTCAAVCGAALHPAVRALHGCNNTACVRVSRPGETGLLHIVSGSQRHNMEMMARARRGGGRPQAGAAAPACLSGARGPSRCAMR
jgi:hypothetical protein